MRTWRCSYGDEINLSFANNDEDNLLLVRILKALVENTKGEMVKEFGNLKDALSMLKASVEIQDALVDRAERKEEKEGENE